MKNSLDEVSSFDVISFREKFVLPGQKLKQSSEQLSRLGQAPDRICGSTLQALERDIFIEILQKGYLYQRYKFKLAAHLLTA